MTLRKKPRKRGAVRILRIIEELENARLKAEELSLKTKIPKRTVYRLLNLLKEYDIIGQDKYNRFFLRYERTRVFRSKYHYDLMLKHSKELVPAFFALATFDNIFSPRDPALYEALDRRMENQVRFGILGEELKTFAEEHLKTGYPHTYETLKQFRKIYESDIKYNIGALCESDREKVLRILRLEFIGSWSNSEEKPKNLSREEINRAKLFKEIVELYDMLVHDIRTIIIQVRMGNPLKGRCKTCPSIEIQ